MSDQATDSLEGLSLTELLDRMNPVVEPEPVAWMPQTTAWAVLGLIVVLLAALAAWRWLRRRQQNRYRREALAELDRIQAEAGPHLPLRVAELLRRTALTRFDRRRVASLTGDAWLAFLVQSSDGRGFSDGPGRLLVSAPYKTTANDTDNNALINTARHWIRAHHAGV